MHARSQRCNKACTSQPWWHFCGIYGISVTELRMITDCFYIDRSYATKSESKPINTIPILGFGKNLRLMMLFIQESATNFGALIFFVQKDSFSIKINLKFSNAIHQNLEFFPNNLGGIFSTLFFVCPVPYKHRLDQCALLGRSNRMNPARRHASAKSAKEYVTWWVSFHIKHQGVKVRYFVMPNMLTRGRTAISCEKIQRWSILAIESVLIPLYVCVIGYWVISCFALHPAWWIVPVLWPSPSAWVDHEKYKKVTVKAHSG